MPQSSTSATPSRAARRSRQWWQAQVLAWRDSGLSKAAYCAANGLNAATFYGWSRRLQDDIGPTETPLPQQRPSPFVQALVQEERELPLAQALSFGGVTLTFEQGLDPRALPAWVEALRTLPC